jgi:ribosomal-protein-alanine N-acetyltransferase
MARLTLHPIARDGAVPDFGARLPPQAEEVCATFIALYAKSSHEPPWIGYLVAHAGVCIGTCAFTSAPKPAAPPERARVEIAYFTFSDFEGRGYATEMAQQLIALAAKTDPDVLLFAHTLPQENASTRILRKVTFTLRGPIDHPEDGTMWLWEL